MFVFHSLGVSEVTGFINTRYQNPREDYPDIQFFFGGFLASCAKTGQIGETVDNGTRSVQIIPTVLHPKSRGYLKLKNSDPLSPPLIYANYYTHPDDIKVMIEGIKIGLKLAETKALRKYGFKLDKTPTPGCENIQFGTEKYWECSAKRATAPENHQAGSCKMGPSNDPMAVVSPTLQVNGIDRLRVVDASIIPKVTTGNTNAPVYGIDRLRVVDASIIPKVTTGNTNAPVIMIAEKASDMIKSRWIGNDAEYFYQTGNNNKRLQI
nr:unnamed protein product [Callosobruchus analis]